MILAELRTRNFRNLARARLEFHDEINLIVGDNGQGKTSLLEAIYFLGTTKSFRTNRVTNLFSFNEEQLFVEGVSREGTIQRRLSIGLDDTGPSRRRQLLLNGQPAPLRAFVAELPMVAFSSARLEIIRGGPDERRRFLDRGIAVLRPGYLAELSRFQRALRQRNALLQDVARRRRRAQDLEAWDEEWAETAGPIIRARLDYAERLGRAFARVVETYRYPLDQFRLVYRPSAAASSDAILEDLREVRGRELAAGITLLGPHRDDLAMTINDYAAEDILSAGETKVAILFLKMAKLSLMAEAIPHRPVFLVDDIDAELDLGIIEQILGDIRRRAQVFTTSSKESIFDGMNVGPFQKYRVCEGSVEAHGDHG